MAKKAKELKQAVTITRDEAQPEDMQLVAKAILDVADGFSKMNRVLTSRALELLLHDMTKVGIPSIRAILHAAPKMADTYLRKPR